MVIWTRSKRNKMWLYRPLATVLIILCTGISEGRHRLNPKQSHILEEQKRDLEEYETNKEEAESLRKNVNGNVSKIDSKFIDPDDPFMRELLSMGVGIDGVIMHPKGLFPEKSKRLGERELDRTIESEEEIKKEREGKNKKRTKRNFGPKWKRWPLGVVPYIFDDNLVANRESFLKVIELFNNLTCIRFKPKFGPVEREVGHKGYVRVQNGSGCTSGVGFYGDFKHPITLKEPGCGSVGITAHEMLHRLGQNHEHTRSDRDRYVRIVWENIPGDKQRYFEKRRTYDRNPYDIGSVMQYSKTTFGGGKTTIEVKDKKLQFLQFPGNDVFSFYDLKDVLDQYECTAHCTSPPVCQNGGYVNVHCGCTCPEGFTGTLCELVFTDSDCGGFVYLEESDISLERNKVVFVTDPNYPNRYSLGKKCRWVIKAPDGYIIKMTIDELHMAYNPDTLRCYHWLQIQYNLPGQPGLRRCGNITGETFLTSIDSPTMMIVTMDTQFQTSATAPKGFKLHFEKEREVCRDNLCKYGVCFPNELKACQYKCLCQPGYTGRYCDQVIGFDEVVDCKRTSTGWEYTGKINVTKSGRTCQSWSSQSPHSHSIGRNLTGNYCRNPDHHPEFWCYTTDPNKRWEECDILDCGFDEVVDCKRTSTGWEYTGKINVTKSGRTCQSWSSQSPHSHSIGRNLTGNYCSNPDHISEFWCYTTDPSKKWEACEIPDCVNPPLECLPSRHINVDSTLKQRRISTLK